MSLLKALIASTLAALSLAAGIAAADTPVEPLEDRLGRMFPRFETLAPFDGDPPAAPVLGEGALLGYAILTDLVAPVPGYSGKPIRMLVGVDVTGAIRGVDIVAHEEPILVVGIDESDLAGYVAQYEGRTAEDRIVIGGEPGDGRVVVDGISGATITVMVLNASIVRSVKRVATSRGLPLSASARQDIEAALASLLAPAEAPAAAKPGPAGVTIEAGDDEPIWIRGWEDRKPRIVLLLIGLTLLTAILVFQDWLVRHRALVGWIRIGFLLYTLVFIGWFALAQLSVVNVLTFVHAVMRDFRWETFLIDPLVFILWSFVAMSLLLWGRGVYCGWLCPFGALQELVNKAALHLQVRQFPLPALVHDRLVAIKYVILLALFGLSLQSMVTAIAWVEIEPFKTAITLRFVRDWPFVTYALVLVAISAVNGKFFCKYLCPLGASLAIASHFRIFDWLRRRKECGRPCQTCATECPSQAIRPTGEIDVNECHYCLDCQVTFWNSHKCPPLVERRKKFERRGQPVKLTLR